MEKILQKYNQSVVDPVKLKKKIKKLEQSKKEPPKPTTYEQNDDGWTTVHYKGGRDPTKKIRKKKKEAEKLVNFYAFEVKEAKLKKHKELLEKFEEDKKRIAKMREQRKFKI